MSAVAVFSYIRIRSSTWPDNILKSLKRHYQAERTGSGKAANDRTVLLRGIQRLNRGSRHLERVTLEIFDPKDGRLVVRWDIKSCLYTWDVSAGTYWTDTEQLKWAIGKAGLVPGEADCSVSVSNKPGRPDVSGWVLAPCARLTGWCARYWHHRRTWRSDANWRTGGGLMLTVDEAFRKFKSRLELNDRERKIRSARHGGEGICAFEVRD